MLIPIQDHGSKEGSFRGVTTPVLPLSNPEALTVYKIDYTDVDEKPELLFMCLKRLVGERGFESLPRQLRILAESF